MIISPVMWLVMEPPCSRELKEEIGSLALSKCFVAASREDNRPGRQFKSEMDLVFVRLSEIQCRVGGLKATVRGKIGMIG